MEATPGYQKNKQGQGRCKKKEMPRTNDTDGMENDIEISSKNVWQQAENISALQRGQNMRTQRLVK